jgi:ParB/Sulfiredoxin domain
MTDKMPSISSISVERLLFDPENPRLPSTINGHDEQSVIDWMLRDATIIELMASIGERDYFPGEPLLVAPVPDKEGFYEVIEGNRRLTAVKLLLNPSLAIIRSNAVQLVSDAAKVKPASLPVIIFPHRNGIINYLGYRHITGIKEWGSLAKAKYLKQLLETVNDQSQDEQYKTLAKIIGSRADYVARLLAGLAVYKEIAENAFFKIRNLSEESVNFAVLTTALNYSNIAEFLGLKSGTDASLEGLDRSRLGELTSWLFEKNSEGKTRVGESRNLRQLSAVVANEQALKSFTSGTPLSTAYILTDAPTDIFRAVLAAAREHLQTAQIQIHRVNHPTESDVDLLKEIQTMARDLRVLVSQRIIDAEDI